MLFLTLNSACIINILCILKKKEKKKKEKTYTIKNICEG